MAGRSLSHRHGSASRALRWLWALMAGLGLAASPGSAQEEATGAAAEEHDAGGIPHYPLEHPERLSWSFAGPFGRYDAEQLQRGLQVYREVCAGCHGLSRVAFRTLASENGPFLSEEAMREVAAAYRVADGDTGELRPGRPADYFPTPPWFGAGTPPDLSLMAKARGVSDGFPAWLIDGIVLYQEGGVNYIHALLTGYQSPPAGVDVAPGLFYNPYFMSGIATAMPPPLSDGRVQYADGTPETADQYARDVASFLMWTAEPKLVDRKRLGFMTMVFLVALAVLLYLTKRQVWSKVEH